MSVNIIKYYRTEEKYELIMVSVLWSITELPYTYLRIPNTNINRKNKKFYINILIIIIYNYFVRYI